jgi:hypothetical protein
MKESFELIDMRFDMAPYTVQKAVGAIDYIQPD